MDSVEKSLQPGRELARTLILDELFDLSLYRALHSMTSGEIQRVLDELIQVELKHIAFWQTFFKSDLAALDLGRRLKLWFLALVCRLFGTPAIYLVLEAIEVYGVRKYLTLWETYQGTPLGEAVRGILREELQHEDLVVTAVTERRIDPDKIRNIFLGLNDGLVEILGAVSGFFAAFEQASMVVVAGMTVAVAGAFSMAAGAFMATSAENDVRRTERDKQHFLHERSHGEERPERPWVAALLVGGSYLAGALVPVAPVLVGLKHILYSLLAAGSLIIVVSMLLAFLSGMSIRRRVGMNLVIVAAAVSLTYAIGTVASTLWGIR